MAAQTFTGTFTGKIGNAIHFDAVDTLLTFTGAAPGTTATPTTLNNSFDPAAAGTWTTVDHMAHYASFVSLPGSLSVRGGSTYAYGATGEALAVDDSYNLYFHSYTAADQTHDRVVISGWFNYPSKAGGYDALLVSGMGFNVANVIQIGHIPGTDCWNANESWYEVHLHNSDSSCILIQPDTTYYFTWLLDGSAIGATNKFSLYTEPKASAVLPVYNKGGATAIEYASTQTGHFLWLGLGNNESSVDAGKYTYWQWIMVDWTSCIGGAASCDWPKLLH